MSAMVLVHGGAHGAWCWEPTIAALTVDALAVDLPPKSIRGGVGRNDPTPDLSRLTLRDSVDSVLRDADTAGLDRFVLVGHSLGGLTIAELARRAPERVQHLVFVSCMVPPEGGSSIDALPEELQGVARDALAADRAGGLNPVGLDEGTVRLMFCNDMNETQIRFVLDRIGIEAPGPLAETVTRRGIPTALPKTFVKLLRDQSLPPEHQDLLIEHLRESPGGAVAVETIDAGHDVMISNPHALGSLLNRIAAEATSRDPDRSQA
jgi:pimeloyl-ACP methyl ester carboxylesterase